MTDLPTHSPSTIMWTLPCLAVELTDMIVDHLWDDAPTLRACALVSRTWLDASQYHLFRAIHLVGVGSGSPRSLDAFLHFLERHPRVKGYVRVLDVTGHRRYSPHHHAKSTCLRPRHITALATLPFLKQLVLTSVVWSGENDEASSGGGGIVDECRTLGSLTRTKAGNAQGRRSSLLTLTLSHLTSFGKGALMLQDVLALIAPFPNICELQLHRTNVQLDPSCRMNFGVERNRSTDQSLLPFGTTTHLQCMSLGPVSRASRLYPALAALWLSATIHRLKIQIRDWTQLHDIARFVHRTAHSLISLELDVSSCYTGPGIEPNPEPEHLFDGKNSQSLLSQFLTIQ